MTMMINPNKDDIKLCKKLCPCSVMKKSNYCESNKYLLDPNRRIIQVLRPNGVWENVPNLSYINEGECIRIFEYDGRPVIYEGSTDPLMYCASKAEFIHEYGTWRIECFPKNDFDIYQKELKDYESRNEHRLPTS